MKTPLTALMLIYLVSVMSCQKSPGSAKNLALIQHTWMIVSENGEAFRYLGIPQDYYNFSINSVLYRYVNNTYDTSAYNLLSDGHTLVLYPIKNGVKSGTGSNYNVNNLSDSQLVISSHEAVGVYIIDSLKR